MSGQWSISLGGYAQVGHARLCCPVVLSRLLRLETNEAGDRARAEEGAGQARRREARGYRVGSKAYRVDLSTYRLIGEDRRCRFKRLAEGGLQLR